MTDPDGVRKDAQDAFDDMKGRVKETARVFFRADESDRSDDTPEENTTHRQHREQTEPDRASEKRETVVNPDTPEEGPRKSR